MTTETTEEGLKERIAEAISKVLLDYGAIPYKDRPNPARCDEAVAQEIRATCCHKTRVKGWPCPIGRVCPYDENKKSSSTADMAKRLHADLFGSRMHERPAAAEEIELIKEYLDKAFEKGKQNG